MPSGLKNTAQWGARMNDYALLGKAMEASANPMLITTVTGIIVWANPAFTAASGYALEELIGQSPALFKSGRQTAEYYEFLWQSLLAGQPWEGHLIEHDKLGKPYSVHQLITPIKDEQGAITHFIAVQHRTSLADNERLEMSRLAYYDVLTELPNRAFFHSVLCQAIAQAQRCRESLALMFIDLDRFKPVNDQLGHDCGDRLLVAVAKRLRQAVRKGDCVARQGGDEFTILIAAPFTEAVLRRLALKVIKKMAAPFRIQNHPVQISVSMGIACLVPGTLDADELIKRADQAMYQVKAQGGNGFFLSVTPP